MCSHSPLNSKIGQFTSMFCKGRRNVPNCIMDVQSHCFVDETFCLVTFLFPPLPWLLTFPYCTCTRCKHFHTFIFLYFLSLQFFDHPIIIDLMLNRWYGDFRGAGRGWWLFLNLWCLFDVALFPFMLLIFHLLGKASQWC